MFRLLLCFVISLTFSLSVFAQGDAAHGQTLTKVCSACHGADGNSLIPMFPKLAGQQPDYLIKELHDIQSGKRSVLQMGNILSAYSDQDLSDIAAYFSQQKPHLGQANPKDITQGETLFRFGNPTSGVPACASCHGPAGRGNDAAKFPALRGQHAQYTQTQLQNFQSAKRANDPSGMMRDIAKKLNEQEINALANYIQGLR